MHTNDELCSTTCSNFPNTQYNYVEMDRGIIFGTDAGHTDHWKGDLAGFTLRFPTKLTGTPQRWLTNRYINTTILERHIEDGPVQGMLYTQKL